MVRSQLTNGEPIGTKDIEITNGEPMGPRDIEEQIKFPKEDPRLFALIDRALTIHAVLSDREQVCDRDQGSCLPRLQLSFSSSDMDL